MLREQATRMTTVLTVYYDHKTAVQLLPLIRQVRLDDALTCPHGRLERIRPEVGIEHYILYQNNQPAGVQYVRSSEWLDAVQRGLAALLAGHGWTVANSTLKWGGAMTPLRFEHNRLRHLFDVGDE